MTLLTNGLIALATLVAMEGVAWAAHKYVMHGWGWGWHRSHHETRTGWFERNDLYAVCFAGLAILLMWLGRDGYGPTFWVGVGMTAYGVIYYLVHDGLVHQRWPLRWQPKGGYLKRLVRAHRLHHAVDGRDGCVSFGFVYAPPVERLKAQLRVNQGLGARVAEGDIGRE